MVVNGAIRPALARRLHRIALRLWPAELMSIADLLELERAASKELCRHASLVCARAEEHKSRAQIAHEIAEFKRDVGID